MYWAKKGSVNPEDSGNQKVEMEGGAQKKKTELCKSVKKLPKKETR